MCDPLSVEAGCSTIGAHDCTDCTAPPTAQALLNIFFDGRDAEHTALLFPAVHPFSEAERRPAATSRFLSARADSPISRQATTGAPAVAHWITLRCPKPWELREDSLLAEEPSVQLPQECNRTLYDVWWRVFNRTASEALSDVPVDGGVSSRRRMDEYGGCANGCPDDWLDDGASPLLFRAPLPPLIVAAWTVPADGLLLTAAADGCC